MRVLIATVTAGAGHLQAAAALEEAWKALRPRDTVDKLDVLNFTPKLYRKVYIETYLQIVERAPELWGHIFKKTDNPALVRKLTRSRRALAEVTTSKFIRQLKNFKPDVVLCTHYMPLEIMGHLRAEADLKPEPLTVSIVTDFEAHALWMEPGVNIYCVAADETKARLVARGVPEENIRVTGIPIASKFAKNIDAAAVRKRLGLRDDLPVILVLGGGFGMGPVTEILQQLNHLQGTVQIVIVCGRNEELRREIAVLDKRHPTHVMGFVTNMEEFLAVSDIVLTKPGGLTTSEALALGKPIFIINPIPGQEAANSDFLLEHGAAVKVNALEDIPFRLQKLLGTSKLNEMSRLAKSLGKPTAADSVCREVLARLEQGGMLSS